MVTIYSTSTCPKCKLLKEKFRSKKIMFEENQDINEMIKLGIDEVPKVMINNKLYNFNEAMSWANKI